MKFLALALLALQSTAVLAKVSYKGAKAVRVPVGDDVSVLAEALIKLDLPTWKNAKNGIPAPNSYVDFVVPADKVKAFEKYAKKFDVEVLHEDLGEAIEAESAPTGFSTAAADLAYFNAYHPYAEHLTFLQELVTANSGRAEIVTAGNSGQGRPITGIHFWGSGGKGSKPAIVLHGQVHAREWITGMTVEYLAYNLLSKYATDTEIKGFVDKYDFYFFPVVNPDGFVFTQTSNRLWRKNRQANSGNSCIGRDINRNWPYQWAISGGASTNPCAEDYKGAAAGDASELTPLKNYLATLAAGKGVQLFIDVHSYSQLFMTPYGYSCTAVPTNNTKLQSLAKGVAAAIKAVYNTSYKYGPICNTIYKATGNSVDYVYDVTKAKYSFTIELRDTGANGFVLPASQILPTGVETYAGFRHLLLNM